MSRILGISLLFLLVFSFAGTNKTPQPWPQDSLEYDLAFSPDDSPALIPYDEAVRDMEENPYRLLTLPELPEMPVLDADENYALVAAQSPVKNQGSRGQCHNFAVTGAIEYSLWAGLGEANNFSEQCNAWKFYNECDGCCHDPESDNDGGWPNREIEFIKDKFMKYEKDFEYSSDASGCKTSYNDEPFRQLVGIEAYKLPFERIKEAIDNNFVVLISTLWSKAGWSMYGIKEFKASYDECSESSCGGHAVLAVGYDDNYFGTGRGGVIFKNSWGRWWGWKKGEKPTGFGILPYTYLQQFAYRYIAVTHTDAKPDEPFPEPSCGENTR